MSTFNPNFAASQGLNGWLMVCGWLSCISYTRLPTNGGMWYHSADALWEMLCMGSIIHLLYVSCSYFNESV